MGLFRSKKNKKDRIQQLLDEMPLSDLEELSRSMDLVRAELLSHMPRDARRYEEVLDEEIALGNIDGVLKRFINACLDTGIIAPDTRWGECQVTCEEEDDKHIVFTFSSTRPGYALYAGSGIRSMDSIYAKFGSLMPIFHAHSWTMESMDAATARIIYDLVDRETALSKFQPYSWLSNADAIATGQHKEALIIGKDSDGNDIRIDGTRAARGLIAGISGSGKTQAVYALLTELAQMENTEAIVIDTKGVEYQPASSRFDIVSDEKYFNAVLFAFVEEMERRIAWLKDNGEMDIPVSGEFPRVWLVIDDVSTFLDEARAKALSRILSKCHLVGMSVMTVGQDYRCEHMTESIVENLMDVNLVFHTSSPLQTTAVSALPALHTPPAHAIPISQPGRCYFSIGIHDDAPAGGRIFFVSRDQLAEVCQEFSTYHKPLAFVEAAKAEADKPKPAAKTTAKKASTGTKSRKTTSSRKPTTRKSTAKKSTSTAKTTAAKEEPQEVPASDVISAPAEQEDASAASEAITDMESTETQQ